MDDLTHDYNFIKAIHTVGKIHYLIVQKNGICVGTYATAISFDFNGRLIDYVDLSWDWGYDGFHHYGEVVSTEEDSIIYQEIKEWEYGENATCFQTEYIKNKITCQQDGYFKVTELKKDTIRKLIK